MSLGRASTARRSTAHRGAERPGAATAARPCDQKRGRDASADRWRRSMSRSRPSPNLDQGRDLDERAFDAGPDDRPTARERDLEDIGHLLEAYVDGDLLVERWDEAFDCGEFDLASGFAFHQTTCLCSEWRPRADRSSCVPVIPDECPDGTRAVLGASTCAGASVPRPQG